MTQTQITAGLTESDLRFLQQASAYLENPSFLMKVANWLGKPVEVFTGHLPQAVQGTIGSLVDGALSTALRAALLTMPNADVPAEVDLEKIAGQGRWRSQVIAGLSGAVGGAFGLTGLAIELPLTTTVILRNIAAIAATHGEDLSDPDIRLQCLSVFHLAGAARANKAGELSAMESSYYAARLALNSVTREAAAYLGRVTAQQLASDLASGASPTLVRLAATLASRFNVVVSQKVLAQSIPALGAVGGALVNTAFNDHFDRVARFHFGVRALERRYGREKIQAVYQHLLSDKPADTPPPQAG